MNDVSMADLDLALDLGLLGRLKKLFLAMALAPLAYVAIGYAAIQLGTSPGKPVEPIFLFMLVLVSVGDIALAWWMPEQRLKKMDWRKVFAEGMPIPKQNRVISGRGEIVAAVLNGYFLLRLALIHSLAIYGLLIVFMAGTLAQQQPMYYLALAPSVLISGLFLLWMPTEDKLRRLFEKRVLNQ